jgi:outer membrane biosynthesis protein TonB
VTVASLLALACAAHRHVDAPADRATREGQTSVHVLTAPDVGTASVEASDVRITPAYASPENALPDYPAYALRAGCRDGLVPVRVHVGADGNVTAQRDIPGRPLPDDQCHSAFRAAVQGAVRDWKFAPAFRVTQLPGRDPGDGRPTVPRWEQSPIAIYVDLEFAFQVVEGKGVVRSR